MFWYVKTPSHYLANYNLIFDKIPRFSAKPLLKQMMTKITDAMIDEDQH